MRRVESTDGLGLACHEAGRRDGRLALLLHGLSGNASIWDDTHPALAPRFRVAMPDMRGHGESDRTEDPADFTVGHLVRDVVAVLDAYEAEKATLIGHGLGGAVCQQVALEHPDRVEALVLVGTGPGPLDPRSGWAQTRTRIADVVEERGLAAGWDAYLESGIVGWEVDELPSEILGRWRNEFMKTAPAAFVGLVRSASEQPDRSGLLAGIAAPTLVVVGEDDQAFGEAAGLLAKAVPGADFVSIPGGGHTPHVARSEEFNEAVIEFLRKAMPTRRRS